MIRVSDGGHLEEATARRRSTRTAQTNDPATVSERSWTYSHMVILERPGASGQIQLEKTFAGRYGDQDRAGDFQILAAGEHSGRVDTPEDLVASAPIEAVKPGRHLRR